jgi:hypothetical protein
MAENNKHEPKLPKIKFDTKPYKMLPKYALSPQLPKNDPLLKYIKEFAKDDRRK